MTVELSRINTFEGGSAGSNITVANSNSDSGDPFSFVLFNNSTVGATGNAAITYASSAAVLGVLGCHFEATGTSASYLRWDLAGSGPYMFGSVRIKAFPGNPAASVPLIDLRATSTAAAFLAVRVDGSVRVRDRTNTEILASTSPILVPGNSYTFELAAKPGTTATDGYLAMRIYNADGSLFHSWSSNAVDAGTSPLVQTRINAPLASSGWSGLDVDNVQARLASDPADWIGHFNPVIPPNAGAAATPGVAIIDATGTTGSITLTYSIELLTGPGDAGEATALAENIWWVPQHADTDCVWRVTVTDTATSLTDTVDVTVPHLTIASSLMPTLRYFDGITVQTI